MRKNVSASVFRLGSSLKTPLCYVSPQAKIIIRTTSWFSSFLSTRCTLIGTRIITFHPRAPANRNGYLSDNKLS